MLLLEGRWEDWEGWGLPRGMKRPSVSLRALILPCEGTKGRAVRPTREIIAVTAKPK